MNEKIHPFEQERITKRESLKQEIIALRDSNAVTDMSLTITKVKAYVLDMHATGGMSAIHSYADYVDEPKYIDNLFISFILTNITAYAYEYQYELEHELYYTSECDLYFYHFDEKKEAKHLKDSNAIELNLQELYTIEARRILHDEDALRQFADTLSLAIIQHIERFMTFREQEDQLSVNTFMSYYFNINRYLFGNFSFQTMFDIPADHPLM